MKRILLIASLLLCPSAFLLAQNEPPARTEKRIKVRLSGKITDQKTGELLPGASIYFADDKIGVSAGEDGRYILNNIPPGPFNTSTLPTLSSSISTPCSSPHC